MTWKNEQRLIRWRWLTGVRLRQTARLVALLWLLGLVGLPGSAAGAAPQASFTVTTTSDSVDAVPGDGFCADSGSACSLRAAIQEANALAGTDTITLPAGTYTLSLAGANEDAAATGDLDLTQSVTITGAGASTTTINANTLDRVFETPNGSVTASLSGLTITGGAITGPGFGGGIRNGAGNTLTLDRSTVSSNSAASSGGGIGNSGTLIVTNSTISTNTVGSGGGIFNNGSLSITNSTISGNTVLGNGGGLVSTTGTATLNAVTISNNRADSDNNGSGNGGGIFRSSGTVNVARSIIAGNFDGPTTTHPDCSGTFVSGLGTGDNVIGDNTGCTGFTDGVNEDRVGTSVSPVDPLVGALGNNGGPTQTHALLAGSPAIDQVAVGANCVVGTSTDQRGAVRGSGANRGDSACDSGAYEFNSLEQPNVVTLHALRASRPGSLLPRLALPTVVALTGLSAAWLVRRRLVG